MFTAHSVCHEWNSEKFIGIDIFCVWYFFLLGHIYDMRGRYEYVKLCPLLHCPHADHTSIIHKHTEQTPNIYSINCCPVNFLINYQFIECVQEHGSNETATADNAITMHIQIKYIYRDIYIFIYIYVHWFLLHLCCLPYYLSVDPSVVFLLPILLRVASLVFRQSHDCPVSVQ